MKVVLLKDVKNMGRAGSVVECSDGHALNFLMPRRMAAPATDANVKQAEMRSRQAQEQKEMDVKMIEERLAALAEGRTVITKKANDKGHLYDAVDADEIAKATSLPEGSISLAKPIKELGEFEIPVSMGESFGKLTIAIVAE